MNNKGADQPVHLHSLVITFFYSLSVKYKTCTVKPVLRGHSKRRPKVIFEDRLSLNAGQKYCRMLHQEHSAILLTFIMLPFVIKTFVLYIFEWPFYTGFTVAKHLLHAKSQHSDWSGWFSRLGLSLTPMLAPKIGFLLPRPI